MNLSDKTVKKLLATGEMVFTPELTEEQIQPGSIDLKLGNHLKREYADDNAVIDTSLPICGDYYVDEEVADGDEFRIRPGEFVLATTKDYMKLPDDVGGEISGRSSIGRLGLFVENAGWVDPGFEGEITLELHNASKRTLIIRPGMRICQIKLVRMDAMPDKPYRGKYQGQRGATPSRVHMDKENQYGKQSPDYYPGGEVQFVMQEFDGVRGRQE